MATTSRFRKLAPEFTEKDASSRPTAERGIRPGDETDQLLQSPENTRRLLKSIADLESGEGSERELID